MKTCQPSTNPLRWYYSQPAARAPSPAHHIALRPTSISAAAAASYLVAAAAASYLAAAAAAAWAAATTVSTSTVPECKFCPSQVCALPTKQLRGRLLSLLLAPVRFGALDVQREGGIGGRRRIEHFACGPVVCGEGERARWLILEASGLELVASRTLAGRERPGAVWGPKLDAFRALPTMTGEQRTGGSGGGRKAARVVWCVCGGGGGRQGQRICGLLNASCSADPSMSRPCRSI